LARNGTPSKFTFDPGTDGIMTWSPDGSQIAFGSNRSGAWNIYVKAADGQGPEQPLTKNAAATYPQDWSRERGLVILQLAPSTGLDLWALPLAGDRLSPTPMPLVQTPFNEDNATVSPDGRWIAYDSNEQAPGQVYVRPMPTGAPRQVSRGGGLMPMWRGDGKELFFVTPDGTMMSAGIDTTTGFAATVPQVLFHSGIEVSGNRRQYAVTRDGKRFLVNAAERGTSTRQLAVTVNWPGAVQK
jgi:Tol biopolymer transport system component